MDAQTVNAVNVIFSTGTLISIAGSLVILIGLITKDKSALYAWSAKHSVSLVFAISFAGMIGSLTYQFIGFVPCAFCWYQRIFMYPIAIISFVSMLKSRGEEVLDYSLVLAIIGAVLALWHNIEKILGRDVLACDAIGVSCLQNYVKGFGFIDIPVMSLVFFIVIILIIVNQKRFAASN